MEKIHIIGGGISGLSAGVFLADRADVCLYEASGQAGGRCRSFVDSDLKIEIDNGNHLLVGACRDALSLINKIGSFNTLETQSDIPFISLKTGERWCLNPRFFFNSFFAYTKDWYTLFRSKNKDTVADCLEHSGLYETFWKPLAVSILNTPPEIASAHIFRKVMKDIFFHGRKASIAYIPKQSWANTIIDPAVSYIENHGGKINFYHRIEKIEFSENKVSKLKTKYKYIDIKNKDKVILAVPPHTLKKLVPEIVVPLQSHSIITVYFKYNHNEKISFIGITGGISEWIFFRKNIIAVTVSAADNIIQQSHNIIAKTIWNEVRAALHLSSDLPIYKVIKEKRATFSSTQEEIKKRPECKTKYSNLFLIGDYTNTALPATIESAVRSAIVF